MQYVVAVQSDLDGVSKAADPLDMPNLKRASGKLADSLRLFRLSLESSGPPPASIAIQGRAVIEASRQWEESSRRLANCVSDYCITEMQETLTGSQSWSAALQELTKAIE